jgi:acyl dehydratase
MAERLMTQTLTLDEYRNRVLGEEQVSDWLLVDQAMIQQFADLTHDWTFLHVDPDGARAAGFDGTIAHGFLTMSLIPALLPSTLPRIEGVTVGFNYGFNRLRLIAPLPSGKRIRGRFRVKDCAERAAGEYLLTIDVTIEVEAQEKPALVAEWLILNRVA